MELNINFSQAVIDKVKQLKGEEDGGADLKLRVFVTGGGCSGMQYGFSFEEADGDGDFIINKDGQVILIDPVSYQYLEGADVDYTETDVGAQFVIRNPKAQNSCGCGKSFGI